MSEDDLTEGRYKEAIDFLFSFVNYERNSNWKYDSEHFNLGRVERFFDALGNPHKKGRFVHVAGTNGKGSVSSMIASALSKSGYLTGLYTSPHLISFQERIRVDGREISKQEVVKGVARIRQVNHPMHDLTFFEVWTGLAFDHFAARSVDVSVIEVGIGGILDTTNVITPQVSVITSISMDHRGKLGNTVEEIAAEKAGIIKYRVPVVSAPQKPGVLDILEKHAALMNTRITCIGRDAGYHIIKGGISYSGIKWHIADQSIPLEGAFQCENAAVALAALEALALQGYRVTPDTARVGIAHVSWPGRLQKVAEHPMVIVDGACNTDAMMKVRDYIRITNVNGPVVSVFGICADKDIRQVLDILSEAVSYYVFTRADNPRAMDARKVAELCGKSNHTVEPDSVSALKRAVSIAEPDGLVIVTGSLYLVGEIMRYYGLSGEFGEGRDQGNAVLEKV